MKTSTPFYKIEKPTTQQIFDAIINNEYTPIEKIAPKAKQIKVLLMDYYCSDDVLVTFDGVTNTGGLPIFLTGKDSLYDIASEINSDWYDMSEEDQNNEIELLGCYLQNYDTIFNL